MGKDIASDRLQVFFFFFSQEEQKLLIQTFFDDKIQRMLDGTCRDKQVYVRKDSWEIGRYIKNPA